VITRSKSMVLSLLIVSAWLASCAVPSDSSIDGAITRLVSASEGLPLWPWQGPIAEVHEVAQHGRAVAPRLLDLISYEPGVDVIDVDWPLEQQVELALCEIYGEVPVAGRTVFGNRAADDANQAIKAFWRARIERDPGPQS